MRTVAIIVLVIKFQNSIPPPKDRCDNVFMRWEDLKTSYCRDAEEDTFLDIHSEGKSLKSITRNFPHGEPKSSDGSEVDPRMVVRDDIQRLNLEQS